MQLAELAIFTDDVATNAAFYERLLGTIPDYRDEGIAIFDVGGVLVLIHETCLPGPNDPPCENHVAFSVADVDQAVADLQAKGLVVEVPPRNYDWGRSAYLRDPDGRLIEVHQPEAAH